jgi:hypothetical protein
MLPFLTRRTWFVPAILAVFLATPAETASGQTIVNANVDIDFGSVQLSKSSSRTLRLRSGEAAYVSMNRDGEFTLVGGARECTGCSFRMTFTPETPTTFRAKVMVNYINQVSPVWVGLEGTGAPPPPGTIAVLPSPHDSE